MTLSRRLLWAGYLAGLGIVTGLWLLGCGCWYGVREAGLVLWTGKFE